MSQIVSFFAIIALMLFANTVSAEPNTVIPEGKPFHLSDKYVQKNSKAEKLHAGWIEKACIDNVDFTVPAKLDTGAKTSSINAEIIKEFERDGKAFILYRLVSDKQKSETFESEVTRYGHIKKRKGEKNMRRPYVMMNIRLGKYTVQGEVNLTDRSHFNYPLLVGRNMLSGYFTVDSQKTYLLKTKCVKDNNNNE